VPAFEAAKSIDLLKRRTGDLGGSFSGLMKQVNKSVDGLGVSYQEGGALANAFTRVAGSFQGGDLRAAIGFARATGMDLGASTDFFGTMRRMGDLGRGESEMKRFAWMIGQAVSASGYSGQVEAITKAVAAYATTSARFGLSAPNIDAYLGAFAGLTRTGIPGLDPEGAAAMLGRADATVRAGGAGRWGQAFMFQALGRGIGDPYAVQALHQQGIFGSGAGAFSGPWADMVKQFGGTVPGGTLTTNFSKIRAAFGRVMAGTGSAAPAAFAQLLGLPSAAQGAALYEMKPAAFDNLMNVAQRYGVSLKNISATGMMDFGRVTQAHGVAGLLAVRDQILGRGDLNAADRNYLSGLSGGSGESALRQALGKFALSREQEDTPATMLRRFSTDLQDTITEMGEKLLSPLNGILNAANHIAGFDTLLNNGYLSSGNGAVLAGADPSGRAALSAALSKSGRGARFNALAMAIAGQESGFNPGAVNGASSAAGPFQFLKGTWAQFGAGGFRGSWNDNLAALAAEMHAADYKAMHEKHRHTTTVEELMAHRYGLGAMFNTPTPGVLGEAARVDHYLHVEIKQGGATVAKKSLPLTAGAPIVPAGGGTIVAPGP
jgi:Transglycosylase SLT domain